MSFPAPSFDLFGFADVAVPSAQRSRVTNNPMRRHRGRSAEQRRIRDLYHSYLDALGNPPNAAIQERAAHAAEAVVVVEIVRARFIATGGAGDSNQLVRLENVAQRAKRRLGLPDDLGAPAHVPLRERLAASTSEPSAEVSSLTLRQRLADATAAKAV